MKIDYCPKCNKAGLKHQDLEGRDANGLTRQDRWERREIKSSKPLIPYGLMKWCPRCKEWEKPINHPYIGVRRRRGYLKH